MKRVIIRFINGFCYSAAITLVIQAVTLVATGHLPLVPDFTERFESPVNAYVVQLLLIGLMSAVTAAGTSVFESKKTGLLLQSVLFLIIMLASWIPVACFVWSFHRYCASMISTLCAIVGTYAICWGVMYRLCRRDIDEINGLLKAERKQNE